MEEDWDDNWSAYYADLYSGEYGDLVEVFRLGRI